MQCHHGGDDQSRSAAAQASAQSAEYAADHLREPLLDDDASTSVAYDDRNVDVTPAGAAARHTPRHRSPELAHVSDVLKRAPDLVDQARKIRFAQLPGNEPLHENARGSADERIPLRRLDQRHG